MIRTSIKYLGVFTCLIMILTTISCGEDSPLAIFSVENDKQLGEQVAAEIAADTSFTILAESEYPEAYAYLNSMTDAILNSGEVKYKDEFVWKLHIIDEDVLNAFATPGGYIYVYTGLIKYLNSADDLAGVMGHELAHADLRHSHKRLLQEYAVSTLLSMALGQESGQIGAVVGTIAGTGVTLKFSRDHEAEADEYSVKYLANTEYACNGAASFFELLLEEEGGGGTPEFLSTHPSPSNRVEDINAEATELKCDTTPIDEATGMTYADFKNSIP